MALTTCPECRIKISDQASFCPNCGYKPNSKIGYTSNQYEGKKIILTGKLLIGIGVLITLFGSLEGSSIGIGIFSIIIGIIISKVGKLKNWYHN